MLQSQKSQAADAPCILVVEADLVVRHPVAEYLRQCGYKVIEAISTDEAERVLTKANVDVDIVLVDAKCPGERDGFGLARWMREKGMDARIILVGSIEKITGEAAELCADGPMLSKPFDHQLLLERIKRELALRGRISKLPPA